MLSRIFRESENGEVTESIPYFGLPLSSNEYVSRSERLRRLMAVREDLVKAMISKELKEPKLVIDGDINYSDDAPQLVVEPVSTSVEYARPEEVPIALGFAALSPELVTVQ